MQRHPDITRRRLQVFTQNQNLAGKLYTERHPVTLAIYSAPGRITYAEAVRQIFTPSHVGQKLGPLWSTHWFKLDIHVPADWAGREVHLLWDSSSEACVWRDGVPVQGLAGTNSDKPPVCIRYPLLRPAAGGEKLTCHIEVACNGLFGEDKLRDERTLTRAEIAVFDRDAWSLLWDFTVIADMAQCLPPDSPRAGQAMFVANQMVNACRIDDRSTWPAARELARAFFAESNAASQHNVSAIGHAHIDTAWLWPLAETRRKCYRTFSRTLRLMEDYPEYKFACSQAQQYAWIKESHPALYAQIKDAVTRGQFIPCGGTWIEPDCNIPSGESLVRQFLVGQRFFKTEFGAYCREFWNPDVFGYNGQLPQIMRGAGIEYFLTQKLSWNQFNQPASHTFYWEGVDGSRVLTHFPPANTYNGFGTVAEIAASVTRFKDHDRAGESYYLFGFGDGGGGPTAEMLERLRRMRDVAGLPRVEQRSPQAFFERCRTDLKAPLAWVGELYFELHRGTYTSQARNKLHNRLCEQLLHDVELLAVVAANSSNVPFDYPAANLANLWQLVLLNQFHDIIPGSSINEVYKDSAAHYDECLASLRQLRDQAIRALTPSHPATGNAPRILAFNTLSVDRSEIVELPAAAPRRQLAIVRAPSMGYAVQTPVTTSSTPVTAHETTDSIRLENAFVTATFNRQGHLVSLVDKRAGNRETIKPGEPGNRFVLFDDEPLAWDAWDVDVFHLEKPLPTGSARSVKIVETDPLRAMIEIVIDLTPTSSLRQKVSLTAISPRLDFDTACSWNERHKFLKVEFPFHLRADHATYEMQFHHLPRPTHWNTSWDLARFEVCAHKWADLSEPDYGVALLNDCKYGYATHGHVMRLSLLRAPKYPDPEADLGDQVFRYALYPHTGPVHESGVVAEAARFNNPLIVQPTHAPAGEQSWFRVDRATVVIDTVKRAEDSPSLIVRLYEAAGTRGSCRLTSSLPVKSVSRCNLLEEDDQPLDWTDNGVTFPVTPFQIVTLKLNLRSTTARIKR
jgi:alpha-mannosidase